MRYLLLLRNYRQNLSSVDQSALEGLFFGDEHAPTYVSYGLSFSHVLLLRDVTILLVNELFRTVVASHDRMMMHMYCMRY